MEKCAQSMLQLPDLPELFTQRNLDTTFTSPWLSDSFWFRRQAVSAEEFFQPSMTHTCESSTASPRRKTNAGRRARSSDHGADRGQGGRRPCDHAVQVPAVRADRQRLCLPFSSSTEWWTFLLCHRDRHALCILCRLPETPQVQLLVVDVPRSCSDKFQQSWDANRAENRRFSADAVFGQVS